MTHNEIHETLFDHTIRFERVIYLAGALSQTAFLPDDLRDFLEVEDDKTVIQAFPGLPLSMRDEDDALELSAEWLINEQRLGFLVQVATPVMRHHKEREGSSSYSWGRYTVEWVYGETMDEVVAKAIAWADRRREAEKSEGAKK